MLRHNFNIIHGDKLGDNFMDHTVKKDPFVPVLFLIGAGLIGGAVFVLVTSLYSTIVRNSIKGTEDNSLQAAVVSESLKPVGSVITTADAPAAAAPASSGTADGEAVYNATCKACHATGVAEAPLFGNKEKWEPRVATGLSALMNTALTGKGAMPPKGGNTALSDDEIKAAILYMTKAAGFDLGGGDAAKKAEPAAAAPAKAAEKKAAPAQPKQAAEPKKPETPATPATPSAPVAPAPKAEPAAAAAPVKEAKAAPAAKSGGADLKKGESIYNATCFACHKTGVAGAPLFGDKKLWAPRIATGMDAMLSSAINGKGAMPPRAGNPSLSDDDLKAAIAYMVSKAQ
jgi:cytochrome c5